MNIDYLPFYGFVRGALFEIDFIHISPYDILGDCL